MKRERQKAALQMAASTGDPENADFFEDTIRDLQKAAMVAAIRWELRQNLQVSQDFVDRNMADSNTLEDIDYLLDRDES